MKCKHRESSQRKFMRLHGNRCHLYYNLKRVYFRHNPTTYWR